MRTRVALLAAVLAVGCASASIRARTCAEGVAARPCGSRDAEMQAAVRALRSCQYARQCGPHGRYLACYEEVRAICARRDQPPGCWQDEAMLTFEPFGDAGWQGWRGPGCLQ